MSRGGSPVQPLRTSNLSLPRMRRFLHNPLLRVCGTPAHQAWGRQLVIHLVPELGTTETKVGSMNCIMSYVCGVCYSFVCLGNVSP